MSTADVQPRPLDPAGGSPATAAGPIGAAPMRPDPRRWTPAPPAWLRTSRIGLVVLALVVGGGAGIGAALFRWLVFGVTWLVTGHDQFGQQGHAPSLHLPFLGIWFVLVAPVVGGLLYGPLIQRWAREARGHGVPEVMLAVAENGGRIPAGDRPLVVAALLTFTDAAGGVPEHDWALGWRTA